MNKAFLLFIAIISLLLGVFIFLTAASAIQQIAAFELFLVATVAFGSAAIIEAIENITISTND